MARLSQGPLRPAGWDPHSRHRQRPARLYRYGGDSLQGRYHLLRLHPLSVAELGVADDAGLHRLLDLGGFPEPWVGDSRDAAARFPDAAATQISAAGTDDYRTPEGIRVQPAIPFLRHLV